VPEHVRFEQGLDQRGAVDHDEGAFRMLARPVDGTRNQFLAGAGLARDEHSGRALHDQPDGLEDLLHGTAASHHGEAARHLPRAVGQGDALTGDLQGLGHGPVELVDVDGLVDAIHGPLLHRLNRALHVMEGRVHDDPRARMRASELV
jgi:hypothetical protein